MKRINVDFMDEEKRFVTITEGDSRAPLTQLGQHEIAQLIERLRQVHEEMTGRKR